VTFRSVVAQAATPLACADDPEDGAVEVPVVGVTDVGALDEAEPAPAPDDDGAVAVLELELAELHPATRIAATPSAAPVSDMRPCAVKVIADSSLERKTLSPKTPLPLPWLALNYLASLTTERGLRDCTVA
jgi:hypothetical protein